MARIMPESRRREKQTIRAARRGGTQSSGAPKSHVAVASRPHAARERRMRPFVARVERAARNPGSARELAKIPGFAPLHLGYE
ncbi:MAG: hypothetical protein AB7I32_17095 [Gammaproteobacteria bacterium]